MEKNCSSFRNIHDLESAWVCLAAEPVAGIDTCRNATDILLVVHPRSFKGQGKGDAIVNDHPKGAMLSECNPSDDHKNLFTTMIKRL